MSNEKPKGLLTFLKAFLALTVFVIALFAGLQINGYFTPQDKSILGVSTQLSPLAVKATQSAISATQVPSKSPSVKGVQTSALPTATSVPTPTATKIPTKAPTATPIPTRRVIVNTPTPTPTPTEISYQFSSPSFSSCSGATAECWDGTCSYSAHRQGTCSHHGGVKEWYP